MWLTIVLRIIAQSAMIEIFYFLYNNFARYQREVEAV